MLSPAEFAAARAWIAGPARGGYDAASGWTFASATSGAEPRPLSAFTATMVHESVHSLQPNPKLVAEALDASGHPAAVRDAVAGRLRFEREFEAFSVQQEFLRGLAGHGSGGDLSADLRVPQSDGYRELAVHTPEQIRDNVLDQYLNASERAAVGPDPVAGEPALSRSAIVDRARHAIAESVHPVDRAVGTLRGPITTRAAADHGLDLGQVSRDQARLPWSRSGEIHAPQAEHPVGAEPPRPPERQGGTEIGRPPLEHADGAPTDAAHGVPADAGTAPRRTRRTGPGGRGAAGAGGRSGAADGAG